MIRIKIYIVIVLLFLFNCLLGQNPENLEQYINLGLENNLKIQQQKYEVQKSLQDVRSTRGAFLPTIDLNARYTRASGGRAFQMPLGDIMNPVYNTLNTIVGEGTFPNIDNLELNFNRTTDVDTRVSLTQPIFDSRLVLQNKIQNNLAGMIDKDLIIEKRDIVYEIKQSYYSYLKVLQLKALLVETKRLVEENLRVSEVLFQNDKVTEDALWRSKTEVRKVEFQTTETEKEYQLAKRYFNLLLNRDMNDSIYVDQIDLAEIERLVMVPVQQVDREELEKILLAQIAAKNQEKLATANNLPNFYFAFDAGYQGSEYAFNSESNYYLASALLKWNIFSGFSNNAMKQKAKIEQSRLNAQFQDVRNNLSLQIEDARLEYRKSASNYETTQSAELESKSNFKIVSRKYEEGLARQVEFIDARTFMTNAAAENIIAKYDVLISLAAYERATASFAF